MHGYQFGFPAKTCVTVVLAGSVRVLNDRQAKIACSGSAQQSIFVFQDVKLAQRSNASMHFLLGDNGQAEAGIVVSTSKLVPECPLCC